MNLKPLLNKIIVEPQEVKETTSGGILIANAKNEGIIKGTVLAVGKGSYDNKGNFVPVSVSVGTEILFTAGIGDKFEYEGKTYNSLTENEIIAVLS